MSRTKLSTRIKKARINANLTQKDVYEKLGIAQSTYSSWEIGKSEPDADTIGKLCGIFDIDVNTFFEWSDEQLSSPGISRKNGQLVEQTTPKQLLQLRKYFDEQEKEPTEDNLIEIIKSLPTEAYGDIKEYLMFMKFKYNRRG